MGSNQVKKIMYFFQNRRQNTTSLYEDKESMQGWDVVETPSES